MRKAQMQCVPEYATQVEINETAMLLAHTQFTPRFTSVCRSIHWDNSTSRDWTPSSDL